MDAFSNPTSPKYAVREIDTGHFVVDVLWPHGAVEQLVGLFATRAHALRWLLESGETGN